MSQGFTSRGARPERRKSLYSKEIRHSNHEIISVTEIWDKLAMPIFVYDERELRSFFKIYIALVFCFYFNHIFLTYKKKQEDDQKEREMGRPLARERVS